MDTQKNLQEVRRSDYSGFITLISVLIVSAISVVVSVMLLIRSTDAARTNTILEQSLKARALADACAERALGEIQKSASYDGNETLTLPTGSCSILSIGGSGDTNRTIKTSATVGSTTRRVRVIVQTRRPAIQATSWEEVADF